MATDVADDLLNFKEQKAMILSTFYAQKRELIQATDLIKKSDSYFLASIGLDRDESLKRCAQGKEIFEVFSMCMQDAHNGDELEKCNAKLQDQEHYNPLIDGYLSFYHAIALQYAYAKANQNLFCQDDEAELKIALDNLLSMISSHTMAMDNFTDFVRIKIANQQYPLMTMELKRAEQVSDGIYLTAKKFLTLKEKSKKQKIYNEYLILLSRLQEQTKQLYLFEQKLKK